ncbi:MAG: TIGR03960 family B12-binding radical SAM protein [Candidatus Omnitrophota bacterium]
MGLEELLLTVQKPARYIGGEWNSVRKEWKPDRVKFLLAFPDTYEVGMSHLGMKILYGILNERDDCLCERVFSPWSDLEDALRKNDIRLFSLESRRPIKDFDLIGFSVTYELSYTNILNILDLGGIPKRSSERTDDDPIVIAGGPSCYNPEPIAEFIDAFFIGEAEEAVGEIVEAYKSSRSTVHSPQSTVRGSRRAILRELAKIEGVYVPEFYGVEYNPDGTIKRFFPKEDTVPPRIRKRVVEDLENAFYPTKQIVPYISVVHDRITIEIMRGCKHACKFCQACAIYRPCRERSREKVLELARETYRNTGYDEISLLSLSSGDHSGIKDIIAGLNSLFKDKAVSVSVPSLRVEDILKDLPSLISEVKKAGLTFAPEAGSEALRKAMNKDIDIEKLFRAVSEAFRAGWRRVKLYFMIGLPSETDGDLLAIAGIIRKISDLKRAVDGRPAEVKASINAFVPKPHTFLQREPMDEMKTIGEKQKRLAAEARSKRTELDFHSLEMSYLEAALSRGSRKLSGVIYEAWAGGGRFDAWRDRFDLRRWLDSFKKNGVDPHFYVSRKMAPDEILPWDFIDIGFKKDRVPQ